MSSKILLSFLIIIALIISSVNTRGIKEIWKRAAQRQITGSIRGTYVVIETKVFKIVTR